MADWINRIEMAESARAKVDTEYNNARNYYEDEQEPDDVPPGKDYIQENIITDSVDRNVGTLLSGDIKVILKGGGPMSNDVKELHDDILEANKFYELVLPAEANKFNCEGLGGFKFVENPYKVDRYGTGFPAICGIPINNLLLDPNSKTGMHDDDQFRIHKERRTLEYALDKWGRDEKGNKTEMYDKITACQEAEDGNETEKFVTVYECEEHKPKFNYDEGYPQEVKTYYMAKYLNKTLEVEPSEPTDYPCFRMIPMIHTPRVNVEKGRYPMGLHKKLEQQQDQMNITASVVLDVIKASVKNFNLSKGAKPDEQIELKRELALTDGYANIKNTNAKFDRYTGDSIPPDLLQWSQWNREKADDIKGSSNQAQQFQSAASGQLSGKAIGNLQSAGILPEYTKKANIELALMDLSKCIFYYIKNKMGQSFSITREIEGKDKNIQFNQDVLPGYEGDGVVSNGVLNPLSELGEFGVKVEVEMNSQQLREMEINKALIMAEMGKIADNDLMKAMYPNTWKEKLDNLGKQTAAVGLMQEITDVGGEDLLNYLANEVAQYKDSFKEGEMIEQ